MFDLNKYISLLYEEKFIEADSYRISNMPKKIYKYISLKSMNSCSYTEKCMNEEEENNKKITSIRDNKLWLSTYNNLIDSDEIGLKICAVYTGINCNDIYINTIKSICKDLNCKLYKMNIDYSNERFALGKELLDC